MEDGDQLENKLISYWKMKRFSRNAVPLVRRSQLKQHYLIPSTSRHEINKLLYLRINFERVRILVEMVKKRESIVTTQTLSL